MSRAKSNFKCVKSLESNLQELKRRSDLESLRPFLKAEQCFQPHADPDQATITMEELKKLARAWKLHERRNFWKLNPDRDSMVAALLQQIADNKKLQDANRDAPVGSSQSGFAPTPPPGSKPSKVTPIKNFCGMRYFFREVSTTEMIVQSKFYDFPDTHTAVPAIVNKWRGEDFNLKLNGDTMQNKPTTTNVQKNKQDRSLLQKHRNLAAHLARFSATVDNKKTTLNAKAVSTFVAVSETDDSQTASFCMIAISNVSANAQVRNMMLEINAVHKWTPLVPLLKGPNSNWAANLLFYYFSCEPEIEDRIYNSSISLLQVTGLSSDVNIQSISLYTLNNLMPCLDRVRVAELIMTILGTLFPVATMSGALPSASTRNGGGDVNRLAPERAVEGLSILLNACAFTNTHTALLGQDILEILSAVVVYAIRENNMEVGLLGARILMSLLQLDVSIQPVIVDFICVLSDLLSMRDTQIVRHGIRMLAVLSGNSTLLEYVCETDVITVITRVIDTTPNLPMDICKDAARYFSNICRPTSKEYMRRLVRDAVPVSILQLIQNCKKDREVQALAVRGLQNLLSYRDNCVELASVCFLPLLRMMREFGDLGAAQAMFNLSCVAECDAALKAENVHMKILEFLPTCKDMETKAAYLQVLVQMSSDVECISEMMGGNLIGVLAKEVAAPGSNPMWVHVARKLLAVVVYCPVLDEASRAGITQILQRICTEEADEAVVTQCSTVLAFLSLTLTDFAEVDGVMRSILKMSDTDEVMESASTVLFNVTCSEKNSAILLNDGVYLNIMIRMMRSGKADVQRNITEAIRTLCSDHRCAELLLKMDLLSDLIVVALLRTSSESIKIVCNDAFYNMLCHKNTRTRLLKGDLWWAVMRLGRNDSERIRLVFARALFDLSCDSDNIKALRDHHILSFLRDVTAVCTTEFLEECLKCVQNLTSQFDGAFQQHEVVCTVRIAIDALTRSMSVEPIRTAIQLLLKCTQEMREVTVAEALHIEMDRVLAESSELWSMDEESRICITRLIWEMSKSENFTKGLPIADACEIFQAAYSKFPSAEAAENLAGCLLFYTKREKCDPNFLLSMPVWTHILCDTFGVARTDINFSSLTTNPNPRGQAPGGTSTGASLSTDANTATGPEAGNNTEPLKPTHAPKKTILKRKGSVNMLTSLAPPPVVMAAYPVSNRSIVLSIYCYLLETATKEPKNIPANFVRGLLTVDMINNKLTRQNLLIIINGYSLVPALSAHLLSADILQLLIGYLLSSRRTSQTNSEKATEFCAAILLNLSSHSTLLPSLVTASEVNNLITEILEQGMESACKDVSICIYNCVVHYMLKPEFPLNSDFVLQLISKMEPIITDEQFNRINKYVVGVILNKYSYGRSVDPSFVQTQFQEMQLQGQSKVPTFVATIPLKVLPLVPTDSQSVIQGKVTMEMVIQRVPDAATKWQPIISRERKRMESALKQITHAQPVTFITLEPSDVFPPQAFSKIVKSYPKVAIEDDIFLNAEETDAILEFLEDGEDDEVPTASTGGGVTVKFDSSRKKLRNLQENPELES